jgi:hypothetical protein
MKFKKLLVLSMMSLMGTSAWAAVPEGVWSMPEPQGLEFTTFTDDGTHYILYNPVAKMFFASGNGWNTMTSLRTFGMEVWLESATEEDAPEGSYLLCDLNVNNPERSTGSGNIFTDDGNQSWVDHGTQANYSWSYEIVGEYVRFANVAFIADHADYAGMYLGWDGTYVTADNTANSGDHRNAYTAILKHVSPDAAGASVDWKAVTVESYEEFASSEAFEAYQTGMKQYLASFGLKEAIEAAEALNIDVTAALGVYSNTESTVEEMAKAQTDLNQIVEAKKKLKAIIEEYEAKGFTGTDAAKTVLNDVAATKAEVERAQGDLEAAFIEWGSNQASVQNPVDMTSKIKNAHFDNGDCTTGWSGDAFGRGGTVSDGAEHYSKNFDTYQTITGLTPGVYAVGVYGYYRAGNYGGDAESHWVANDEASKYAKLYGKVGDSYFEVPLVSPMSGAQAENQGAGDIEVNYTDPETQETVTVYVPNTMATGDYYIHTLNQYANKLFVAVDESGELTIGVKKASLLSGDWSFFDDFSLTFYGAGADAYQLMLDEALKNFSEVTIDEGTLYTEAYLTAYKEALAGEKTATTQAEVDAIFGSINNSYNDLEKNIKLWQDWQTLVENIKQKYVLDDKYAGIDPEIGDLGDYCDFDAADILAAAALTNEELEGEMTKLNQWVADLIDKFKSQTPEDGQDMTMFINNPGFDEDADINSGAAEGWTIDAGTGGNITRGPLGQGNKDLMENALGFMNYCFEAWHRYNWDVWQEVTNLPVGMYELQVQGYVRCEVGGYNKGDDINPDYPSPVYLYMNDAQSQFPSVYSESPDDYGYSMQEVESWYQESVNDKTYPNSMGGAAQCFGWDMYKTTAYGLIAKKGDVFRIGVKMNSNQDWWCIWDNFKLTYRTPTPEIVKPELEKALKEVDTTQPMGKSMFAKADDAIKTANDAMSSSDGQAMFDALANLYKLVGETRSSVELFAKLNSANEKLEEAVFGSDSPAKADAQNLVSEIKGGIDNHEYDDADVEGLMDKIDAMFTKLALPADMAQASDNNPKECTGAIKSASFSDVDGYENSAEGWINPGNLGNDADQKSVLAIEFWQNAFDMYQTIKGLPKGTYMVTVDAWCRNGGNDENYAEWLEDEKATMAYLYAVDGDSTVYSAPIANVLQGAQTEHPGIDGIEEFVVGDITYYTPNSLMGGRNYMDLTPGIYTNTVIAKVGDDGILTVGIKKADYRGNSWVVADDFRLYYLGENSTAEVSGDPSNATAIAAVMEAPAKVEFFTVGGARISKPGKGVAIMKQIMSDGSVKMRKVVIK